MEDNKRAPSRFTPKPEDAAKKTAIYKRPEDARDALALLVKMFREDLPMETISGHNPPSEHVRRRLAPHLTEHFDWWRQTMERQLDVPQIDVRPLLELFYSWADAGTLLAMGLENEREEVEHFLHTYVPALIDRVGATG